MDLGLKGKVALVTGGSKGIGKAVARGLLEEGAKVAICARTKTELDAASTQLAKATGGEVFAVAGDLTREADVTKIVDATIGRFGAGDTIRTDQFRFTEYRSAGKLVSDMLYDHQADPQESVNLSQRPEQAEAVARLTKQLNEGKGRDAPKAASK